MAGKFNFVIEIKIDMWLKRLVFVVLIFSLLLVSCKKQQKKTPEEKIPSKESVQAKTMTYKILRQFSHPGDRLYTQGFEIDNGILYESSGLYGKSALKKIDLKTGKLLSSVDLKDFFAEGLTIHDGYLTLLTYREKKAYTYSLSDFSRKGIEFSYETEGWGLANNGQQYIMSDGSDRIFFRNMMNFSVERVINVKLRGKPVYYLNELEYVDGKIYANVYGVGRILVIDEKTGIAEAEIDVSNLNCSTISNANPEAVLNGIAYDKTTKTFYITGKECPDIYEVIFE
ncbi:MAG: glutaminyl-peptide cyclotransferase [Sphingobacteriales bacterium]|nr:glutaminyl-peptide cyclotransferase [Sphingobacteriales bacterium]